MELYQELRENARDVIHKADHMLTMTYPMLNEPKILVSVNNNIFRALEFAITSVLEHERLFKRIPPFHDDIDSKFNIFRDKIIPRYGIDIKYVKLILELKETVKAHQDSTLEFARKNKFVIATENYELRTLTANDLKAKMSKAKLFIDEMYNLTRENDRIFE